MKNAFRFLCVLVVFFVFSCAGNRIAKTPISRNLRDKGTRSAASLVAFFMDSSPGADKAFVSRLASLYIEEANAEGLNSDAAFAQMCLETGFLRFGNLVKVEWHNYCGLGAIDEEHPGEKFETEQLGVRAHIQHLHAYATSEDVVLNNELVDKRYKYVKRGRAPSIFELAGTWAGDPYYGEKLDNLLSRMENF
ncbi:MAG: glucosaminidase domain-containing protein [Treponema sp.]|nr:glucosaminidase domain-containing protein [Treponema sp.]